MATKRKKKLTKKRPKRARTTPKADSRVKTTEKAHAALVLDMSGSMETCREATISGFNEWLQSMKKEPDPVLFSMTVFNSIERVMRYQAEPIENALPLGPSNYVPNGMTPLYDAIAYAVQDLEARVGEKPSKSPLVVVMTDGMENASREVTTLQQVNELIQAKEKQGWTFVYLGANQDAWAVGKGLGIAVGNIMPYTSDPYGTQVAFAAVARGSAGMAAGGRQHTNCYFGQSEVTPQPMAGPPKTIQEAADWMNVSTSTVRRQIKDGHLKAQRVGSTLRVRVEDLEDFLKRGNRG